MKTLRPYVALLSCMLLISPASFAASHREAPITAVDRAADITDFFAFVSYDNPENVTFIMNVDPLLEPANGPNYFPFDPDILYAIKIDNNNDAVEDVTFEFRFTTEIRAPGVFTGFVGAGSGINAPGNAPAGAGGGPGLPVIPPAITALDGSGSAGLSLRQSYTVTVVRGVDTSSTRTRLGEQRTLFAVPSNVGPRTMPNYDALARQGIYTLTDVKTFAGTVDDPFFIDLGAVFDSLNLRPQAFGTGVAGVLTPVEDLDDARNKAVNAVSGYNVNTIAIEVPIAMISATGRRVPSTDAKATIGAWATTSRPRTTIRRSPDTNQSEGEFRQVQRMGNPLINEVIIGTGSKDKWSMSQPKDDTQFAAFALDPLLARALNAVFGIGVPNAPRTDLLPLLQYLPPIAAPGSIAGPVADMLRLNTGVPATAAAARRRLGVLGGDMAGYPNGRRITDDITDISLRAVAGVLAGPPFSTGANARLGDGVNWDDRVTQETFPYVAFANSGYAIKGACVASNSCK